MLAGYFGKDFWDCYWGQGTMANGKLKQQRWRRLRKSLKKGIRAASNFIALIPSRLLRQMLANVFGVEFCR